MLIDINTIELPIDLRQLMEDDENDGFGNFVMTFNSKDKYLMKFSGINAETPGRVLLEIVSKV